MLHGKRILRFGRTGIFGKDDQRIGFGGKLPYQLFVGVEAAEHPPAAVYVEDHPPRRSVLGQNKVNGERLPSSGVYPTLHDFGWILENRRVL